MSAPQRPHGGLLSAPRSLCRRLLAEIAMRRAGATPLLVYQMGKVGSTSVCEALTAAGLRPLQVHVLGATSAESRRRFTDRGLPLPYHKVLEQRVGAFLQDSDARVRIVTLVRDPIARAVSGSYQTAWRHDTDTADAESMRDSITRKLSKTNALSYCYNWFDEEVKAVFGIDVMAAPFDPEVGHQQLSGPRADLLLLKLEKLDRLWPVIGAFVGRDLAAVHSNVRSRAQDGESYRQVQSRIALPDARLRALYDHPWMHHFYSPQEIDAFVAKWSGRATADSDGS